MKKTNLILASMAMTCVLTSCDLYGKKDFDKFVEKANAVEEVTYTKATVKIDYVDEEKEDVKVNLVCSKSIVGVATWSKAADDETSTIDAAAAIIYANIRVGTYTIAESEDVTYYTGMFGGFKVTDSDDAKSEFNKYGYLVKYEGKDGTVKISYKK